MKIDVDSFIKDYSNSTKEINDAIKYLNANGGGTLVFKSNKIYGANNIEIKEYNLSVNKNFKNDFGKRINTIDVYQLSIDK